MEMDTEQTYGTRNIHNERGGMHAKRWFLNKFIKLKLNYPCHLVICRPNTCRSAFAFICLYFVYSKKHKLIYLVLKLNKKNIQARKKIEHKHKQTLKNVYVNICILCVCNWPGKVVVWLVTSTSLLSIWIIFILY